MHVFFVENLSLLHIRRVHGENPRCTVLLLRVMHPVGAQNKTLISDTVGSTTVRPVFNSRTLDLILVRLYTHQFSNAFPAKGLQSVIDLFHITIMS